MLWNPDLNYQANVETGMWIPVMATIASLDYPVYARFGGIDSVFKELNSQHTDYELEFRTNDLPGLNVGDIVSIDDDEYKVKTPPAYADESEYFSDCGLERIARSYPKRAINFSGAPLPIPANFGGDDPPIAFSYGDVAQRLIMPLVGAHVIQRVTVVVDQAFNGVGASLTIGTLAAPDLLFAADRVDLAGAYEYEVGGGQVVAAPSNIYLTLNPGVGASQGAGRIFIERVPQL